MQMSIQAFILAGKSPRPRSVESAEMGRPSQNGGAGVAMWFHNKDFSCFETVITEYYLSKDGLLLKFCRSSNFRYVYPVDGYGCLVIERQAWKILIRIEQEDGSSSPSV